MATSRQSSKKRQDRINGCSDVILNLCKTLVGNKENNTVMIEKSNLVEMVKKAFAFSGVKAECLSISKCLNCTRFEGTTNLSIRLTLPRFSKIASKIREFIGCNTYLEIKDKSFILEIPFEHQLIIPFSSIVKPAAIEDMRLPLLIGLNAAKQVEMIDLTCSPHILVCGEKGSGKTNLLKSFMKSMMSFRNEEDLRFVVADLNNGTYNIKANSYSDGLCTKPKELLSILDHLKEELERRYWLFAKAGTRNIEIYNQNTGQHLPYLVIVIDGAETIKNAGLLDDFDNFIRTICAKSKAVGIHMIISTEAGYDSFGAISATMQNNVPICCSLNMNSVFVAHSVFFGAKVAPFFKFSGEMVMSSNTDSLKRYTSFLCDSF